MSLCRPALCQFVNHGKEILKPGPPSDPLTSHCLISVPGVVMRRHRNRSVRLFPFDHSPAPLANARPLKVLPPDFGTMLIIALPTSISPNPPAIVTCSPPAIAGAGEKPTPPPLYAPPMLRPSKFTRPSFGRLP